MIGASRPGPVASRLQGKDHQSQLAVRRQHFVADDFIRHHALDQRLIFIALRQGVGKKRRGNLPVARRLARGEYRDQAPGAVDQLNPDGKVAQFLQRLRSSKRSPSITMSTSNSFEGNRWVTSSYVRNSSVSDRNN